MRLLREWNDNATAEETWTDPDNMWIQLDEDDMPDKLMHALPNLGWKIEDGKTLMRPWHAYIVWGRCVNIPEDGEKDDGWEKEGYSWIAWDINPVTAFGRFWPALASQMTEEDWATTTPGAFAIRLRLLAQKWMQPTAPETLRLSSKDFIPILSPYQHDDFKKNIAWPEAMITRYQWVQGLRFNRSSLADRNGQLTAWRKLAQLIGSRYGVDACKTGSVYARMLAELTTWLTGRGPESIKSLMMNLNANLSAERITNIAGYFSVALRDIAGFPVHLDAHLHSTEERMQFLQDHLNFYSNDPSHTFMAQLFNRYAFNIIEMAPALALLLGKDEAAWPYQLPQMLCELDPKPGSHKLDIAIVGRVEAKLRLKLPLIKELLSEHEYDVGARLAGLLEGHSSTSQPNTQIAAAATTSATVDVIMGADADTSSFVKMAKEFKNSCSYVGIKRDVMAARSDPDYSQPQILSIMLNGRTTDEPGRRSNAIILAQLFLKAKGIRGIDPDMSFAPLMLEQSFPELLGRKCMRALNYPLKSIYDPARTAMNVTLVVPKYFIQQTDANLAGLHQVEKAIEAKLQRDLEDKVDLAAIPAVAALKMDSHDDELSTVPVKQNKSEQGREQDRKRRRENADNMVNKERRPQDREWKETVEFRLSEGGDVFHIGDTAYNVKQMQDDMSADNKFSAAETSNVNFPALVIARVIPSRTKEAERLMPDKDIKFGRGSWPPRWKEIFDFIKLSKYRIEGEAKEKKQGRNKRGYGGGWQGGGGRAAAAAVVTTAGRADAWRAQREEHYTTPTNTSTTGVSTTSKGQGLLLLLMGSLTKPHGAAKMAESLASPTAAVVHNYSPAIGVDSTHMSKAAMTDSMLQVNNASSPRHELTWLERLKAAEAAVAEPRQLRPSGPAENLKASLETLELSDVVADKSENPTAENEHEDLSKDTSTWVAYIPTCFTNHDGMKGGQCLVALPCRRDEVFGSRTATHSKQAQSAWLRGAEKVAEALGLKQCHPLLVGIMHFNSRRGRIAIMAIMTTCSVPPGCCCLNNAQTAATRSSATAEATRNEFKFAWCATNTLEDHNVAKLVAALEGRLRALRAPTPTTMISEVLQVGIGGHRPVNMTPQTDQQENPADMKEALEMCARLERELPQALTAVDRGDAGYSEYARACAARVEPLPLKSIPEALKNCINRLPQLSELQHTPYQHGACIPRTQPMVRQKPPNPPWPMPECDEDIFTREFLQACDEQLRRLTQWHRGQLNRRPKPLFAGLEALQPQFRQWFAQSGSALKCEGVGQYSVLHEAAPYPTHWKREWLLKHLASSKDKQLAGEDGLWLGGIDLLDDSPFLMGICGNLVSAYGLDRMGPTSSAAAQQTSDRLADELRQFMEGSPQLYNKPIPVADTKASKNCRFTTIPWCNDPHGQVPKKDDGIRVIINMSHPEQGDRTGAGEAVVSKNVRAQIHAPQGVAQSEWKHPGEPKPTVGMRAANDAILGALGRAAGLAVAKISIDGWKMFHQFFYATSQLCKMGAMVPLAEKLKTERKRLGITHALVMAMGAAPASANCQRAMNELMRAYMHEFRELDKESWSNESPVVQEFLRARQGMQDDFGPMDTLSTAVIYTDDSDITVLGPAERVERANFAVFKSFGDGGAGMILADAMKWLISSHSLWCGVRTAPTLGILWFDEGKRMKAIVRIQLTFSDKLDADQYRSLVSYISYVNSVIHEHPYMVSTLWRPITAERLTAAAGLVRLTSEERGKLKFWRKRMATCPGTTLARHLKQQRPPTHLQAAQWISTSDAMLGWTDEGVWECGLGGSIHGLLWTSQLRAEEWQHLCTIPVAEYMAHGLGLILLHELAPEAANITLEVDAVSAASIDEDKADSARLRVAHELLMETEAWKLHQQHLSIRHVWGNGNTVADACSRQHKQRAEDIVRAMGIEARWTEVPAAALQYMQAVRCGIMALQLPPPKTAKPRKKKTRHAYDLKVPGGTAIRFMRDDNDLPPNPRGNMNMRDDPPAPKGKRTNTPADRLSPRKLMSWDLPPAPKRVAAVQPKKGPHGSTLTATEGHNGDAYEHTEVGQSQLSFGAKVRFAHLMGIAVVARPSMGLQNLNMERFGAVLVRHLQAVQASAPKNTTDGEKHAWIKWWLPYCEWLGIEPVRGDMEAHSGKDMDGYTLETTIMGGALPWIMARMKPANGGNRPAALPTSGLKVLYHVRRIHLKRLLHPFFVPLSAATQACEALCKTYIAEHGPDAILPQRKEPLTNEMIRRIFSLFSTGAKVGNRTVNMECTGWLSLQALLHTMAQTGFRRKAEVALPATTRWNKACIAMANLWWLIEGQCHAELTSSLFDKLRAKGGFALLRAPPSKSDPLGMHWGPCTIYLRFCAQAYICAARTLALMELKRKVPLRLRDNTPLFVNFSGAVWRHQALTDVFKELLASAGTPKETLRCYSMHSWRIYLACALLAAGASHATIQAMLRWRSEEALRIYARINSNTYAEHLAAASQASVSSIRTTSLSTCMQRTGPIEGAMTAAFSDAWLQAAAAQTFEVSTAADLPVHTEDEIIAQLKETKMGTTVQHLLRAEADEAD